MREAMHVAAFRTVDSTGSTNDELAALARAGAPEGLWLRAETQTGGRGRQGRSWISPPGNFHASTLVRLHPGDPPGPTLALAAAVALHDAVSLHVPQAQIKWPNDLVVAGAKLAGILLEREEDAVVIGLGVNLLHHPELIDREATSISASTGTAPDPDVFLSALAERLSARIDEWRREGVQAICRRWLAAAHPIGTALSTGEGVGLFDGLETDGALRLRRPDGAIRVIHAGDVFFV